MTPIRLARAALSHLPAPARAALLVRRRGRYLREAGVVFVHVPKAAGSSINQALYGRFMGHYTASDVARFASARVAALPRFSVVRDPWSRAVSAWRFARSGVGVGDGVVAGLAKPERYARPEFETFDGFVREWLAHADLTREDGVFQPQTRWLTDGAGRTIVDHVGRLEDLAPTVAWVEARTGRPFAVPHTNRSGDAVDWRALYTPETAAIVGRVYAEDVSRLGYAPPAVG